VKKIPILVNTTMEIVKMPKITKVTKINESFCVYMYDNGFMVELSGQNDDNDYVTSKILCNTVEEMLDLVQQAAKMTRND
jgi:hypothetical protein